MHVSILNSTASKLLLLLTLTGTTSMMMVIVAAQAYPHDYHGGEEAYDGDAYAHNPVYDTHPGETHSFPEFNAPHHHPYSETHHGDGDALGHDVPHHGHRIEHEYDPAYMHEDPHWQQPHHMAGEEHDAHNIASELPDAHHVMHEHHGEPLMGAPPSYDTGYRPHQEGYHDANSAWLGHHQTHHQGHHDLHHPRPYAHTDAHEDHHLLADHPDEMPNEADFVDDAMHNARHGYTHLGDDMHDIQPAHSDELSHHDRHREQTGDHAHQSFNDHGNHWHNEANANNKLKKIGTDTKSVETSATISATVEATDSHNDAYSENNAHQHEQDVELAEMTQLDGERGGEHHDHEVERIHNMSD